MSEYLQQRLRDKIFGKPSAEKKIYSIPKKSAKSWRKKNEATMIRKKKNGFKQEEKRWLECVNVVAQTHLQKTMMRIFGLASAIYFRSGYLNQSSFIR